MNDEKKRRRKRLGLEKAISDVALYGEPLDCATITTNPVRIVGTA